MSEHQTVTGTSTTTTTAAVADGGVNEGAPIGFFAIGIAFNLVLLAAYFIWAWRRWKRPDSSD